MKSQPYDGDLETVITEISRDQDTMAQLLSEQEVDTNGTTSLVINQLKIWSEKMTTALGRSGRSGRGNNIEIED